MDVQILTLDNQLTEIQSNKENFNVVNEATIAESEIDIKDQDRNERSLGENCKKFLRLFGAKSTDPSHSEDINILNCIDTLGIQRRRIYDFINILESLEVMTRLKKNQYKIKPAIAIQVYIDNLEVSQISLNLI